MFVSSSMVAFDKLKTTEATTFRSKTFNFSKSYVSKDMTKSKAEQEVNHYLVLELTLKRKNDPLHQCTTLQVDKIPVVSRNGWFIHGRNYSLQPSLKILDFFSKFWILIKKLKRIS